MGYRKSWSASAGTRAQSSRGSHLAVLLLDRAAEGIDARLVEHVELAEPDLVRTLLGSLDLLERALAPGWVSGTEVHSQRRLRRRLGKERDDCFADALIKLTADVSRQISKPSQSMLAIDLVGAGDDNDLIERHGRQAEEIRRSWLVGRVGALGCCDEQQHDPLAVNGGPTC